MHSLRISPVLFFLLLLTLGGLVTVPVLGQTLYEIKPRILIVFDTSGSMTFDFTGGYTYGDGSTDAWLNGRTCCPGVDIGGGVSRMFAAKEAMTQMLNASGEIEFGLLKFYQAYRASGYTADWYRNNQNVSGADNIRYNGDATADWNSWRNFLAVGFGDYLTPGTTTLSLWRDVNTENDRAEVAMWMDHHEYAEGTGTTDTTAYPGPWNDYLEQELRGDGGTPLAEALVAARSYLNLLRDPATGLDDYRSCRKYTVVILTDGAASSDPVSEVTDLKNDGIDSWVIGLAYSSTTLNNMATAGGGHYDPNNYLSAFTANSQSALTAALFYIVSESLVFEECNYKDDDCDGQIDEGVIGPFCDKHNVLNTDTEWTDGTDNYSNPNFDLVCTDPGESICDGIDDNCDGRIDETPPDGEWDTSEDLDFGTPCVDTDADAYLQTQLADSDAVLSPCVAGTWACISGGDGKTCVNYIGPNPEQCDGADNDCDGLIDEADGGDTDNYGLTGGPCGNSQGECSPGVMTCDSDGWHCIGGSSGSEEVCNGLDDNCNGAVDETYPEAGERCYEALDGGCTADGSSCQGVCVAGVRTCLGVAGVGCTGEVSAASDDSTCNGLDDDCDGQTDEDVVDGAVCPTGADGWVVGGTSICNAGTLQCQGTLGMVCVGDGGNSVVKPGVEVCDGLDNDCDGQTDENLYGACGGCEYGVDANCIDTDPGAGECRVGVGTCDPVNSTPGNPVYLNCTDQGPVPETCNGKDDDCDGQTDEAGDLTESTLGDVCYPTGLNGCTNPAVATVCTGECDYGVIACVSGALTCAGYTAPASEGAVCDDLDNNCNGQIDEGITHACEDPIDTDAFPGAAYGVGECSYGIQYCSADTDGVAPAAWGPCQGARGPVAELCNGLDDDCDGNYENAEDSDLVSNATNSYVGEACGSCDGVYTCERNAAVSLGEIGAYGLTCTGGSVQLEVCNGSDENCNGVADDGIAPVACGGCEFGVDTEWDCINGQPAAGECAVGYDYCIDGSMTTECYGSVGPVAELCDGLDNDCDGEIDEDFAAEVVCQAAVGECAEGIRKCTQLDGELGLHCCDKDTWNTLGICAEPEVSELEVCDGLDNDCDGLIDEDIAQVGQPCGSFLGVCEPGIYKCVETGNTDAPAVNGFEVVCDGGTSGSAEECNNEDDNCNGLVDEDIPDGEVCTRAPNWMSDPALQTQYPEGIGECILGNYECVAGDWVCNVPGPTDEVCDGLDNDCDGLVDENEEVECPQAGSSCIAGECAEPCEVGEFVCPSNKECIDNGQGQLVCMSTVCDRSRPEALPCVFNDYYCTPQQGFEAPCSCDPVARMCVDVCYSQACREGEVCVVADNGKCHSVTEGCMVSGCEDGQICTLIEQCTENCQQCVTDPCAGVTCEDGQYCNSDGQCVGTCADVTCELNQGCRNGQCVTDDPCAGVFCSTGVLCNPATGQCDSSLPNPCQGVPCEFYENCIDGVCVFDSCMNTTCPNGTVCMDGSCYAPGGFVAGTPGDDTDTNSDTSTDAIDSDTGDLSTESGSESAGPSDTGDVPENYKGLDRVLATGTGGCMCATAPGAESTRGFEWFLVLLAGGWFVMRKTQRATLAQVRRVAKLTGWMLFLLLAAGCQTQPFEFAGAGNDDSSTLQTGSDSDSNGGTDSSSSPGGSDDSSSTIGSDDSDSSGDTAGCANCDTGETCCTSELGNSFCVDLNTNPSHCGQCNAFCGFSHATTACVSGTCTMLNCETYWNDINGITADGCEQYCKPTADPDDNGDLCDGVASSADSDSDNYNPVDNDCDFQFDEDVDFDNDPKNCGYCGNVCLFNHATALCVAGVCTMGTCDENWWNRENGQTDGCEYYCDGATDEVEVCDFKDNNCDGQVDESDPAAGAACYPAGSSGCVAPYGDADCPGICQAGTISCFEGNLRCTGYVLAELETCDGVDNNCNGLVDEGQSIACGGAEGTDPNAGVCQTGLAACVSAALDVSDAVYDTDTGCVGAVGPGVERCDGYDNDCDGLTDELASEDGNGNNIELNDGRLGVGCGLGACAAYQTQCQGGEIVCENFTPPTEDVPCNGVDDDCDGIVDEIDSYQCGGSHGFTCNDTDSAGCDPYSEGICQAGTFTCVAGAMVCTGDVQPNCSDTAHCDYCDNLDNDCDGLVDEDAFYDDTDSDRTCGSPCNDGTLQCVAGTISCVGETVASADLCDVNGDDEDCNLLTPNGSGETNYLQSCDGADIGSCEEGYWECGPAGMFCNEGTGDDPEVCDGVDNDCDDSIDEDLTAPSLVAMGCDNCPGTTVVVCAGSAGWVCKYDESAGVDCGSDTDCYSHVSAEASGDCDGIDNDCDGVIDDDFYLATNVSHCGQCNYDCNVELLQDTDNAPNVAEVYCSSGQCRIKSCAGASHKNANGIDSDGCECTIAAVCDSDSACDKCSGGSLAGADDDCDGVADENASMEICDGVDNDCDNSTDEGLTYPGYCNALCDPAYAQDATCQNGAWTCNYGCDTDELECGDTDSAPHPEVAETRCDGIDGNCNGSVDESFAPGGSCSNAANGAVGGCLKYGKMLCDSSGTGTICCDLAAQSSGVCLPQNEIHMADWIFHAQNESASPNGIDDDCDGIVDEEADTDVEFVTIDYVNSAGSNLTFDIFKYEASRGDATISDPGVVSTAACSQPLVMPWTYVNFTDARAACQLLNPADCATNGVGCWDLCTVQQWEYTCMEATGNTTDYPYGSSYEPSFCNGRDNGIADTDIALLPTADMEQCIADWSDTDSGEYDVLDLSGNVEEWTGTASVLGTGTVLYDIRGGSFNDLAAGLACGFDFTAADGSSATYRMENLGFRCCRMDLQCPSADAAGDAWCPDNYWCDGSICQEANTRSHCGDGVGGWEACGNYQRCVGPTDGCQFCSSDLYCGINCTACPNGQHCTNNGSTSSCS